MIAVLDPVGASLAFAVLGSTAILIMIDRWLDWYNVRRDARRRNQARIIKRKAGRW